MCQKQLGKVQDDTSADNVELRLSILKLDVHTRQLHCQVAMQV